MSLPVGPCPPPTLTRAPFPPSRDAYGGMEEYVKWAHDANETAGLSVTEFYTSEAIKDMYKDNFLEIKDRYNKYTNKTYAEDPTILAW